MLFRRNSCLLLALLFLSSALHVSCVLAQDDSWDDDFKKTEAPGGRAFNSTCAGCHGLDGRGGDKGVNIAGSDKVRHLSDAQVSSIIANGVPGTGMPPFHNLNTQQIASLVSYLRILQGKLDARTPPGDAKRGSDLFFGKGECSTCHTISGKGGFLGPDLSAYGSAMSAKAIRDEILRAQRIAPTGYRPVAITTRDGNRLEGVIRNEDNFSVQLQTKDGSFYFFEKSDLQSLGALGQSLMPSNYLQRLSPGEVNDLVSYLMSAAPPHDESRVSDNTEGTSQ